ncbi:MAG: ubiquinol-cytochrome c reductase iron-sulfur subunit [bacterium]
MTRGDVKRRSVLNWLLGTSLGAWAGVVLYPILAYIKPPEQGEAAVTAVRVDTVMNFLPRTGRVVPFGRKPALVLRASEEPDSFRAFYATCTHLDCTVSYREDLNAIFCACHNGAYDLNGINISGPPPRPLTPLKVNVRDGTIFISRETA